MDNNDEKTEASLETKIETSVPVTCTTTRTIQENTETQSLIQDSFQNNIQVQIQKQIEELASFGNELIDEENNDEQMETNEDIENKSMEMFAVGFNACTQEAVRFLVEEEGLPLSDPFVIGLEQHLLLKVLECFETKSSEANSSESPLEQNHCLDDSDYCSMAETSNGRTSESPTASPKNQSSITDSNTKNL